VIYEVSTNPTSTPRESTLTIAGHTFTIVQEGVPCTYSIDSTSQDFTHSGGVSQVQVSAPGGCDWDATTNTDWIAIISGSSGSGDGSVAYEVLGNPRPFPRNGTLTIAGQTFTVNQEAMPCTYSIDPTSEDFTHEGGTGQVQVSAPDGCDWTASSDADWIAIVSFGTRTGDGTLTYQVSGNPELVPCQGTLIIAGQIFTINQEALFCTYSIDPTSLDFTHDGGMGRVLVNTYDACNWTASSDADWITIVSGVGGTGDGTVTFHVSDNPELAPREDTLIIAGQTLKVTQEGITCTYSINPLITVFGFQGGRADVLVTAPMGCPWKARSDADWIRIYKVSGNNVFFLVDEMGPLDPPRQGTLTIAGKTHTVIQRR
jgi:hypothetical protein